VVKICIMKTFTSSLPDNLLQDLANKAKHYKMPKNKIIEKALIIYLDQLKRAEYSKSYSRAAQDDDIMAVAEEGMEDYLTDLNEQK